MSDDADGEIPDDVRTAAADWFARMHSAEAEAARPAFEAWRLDPVNASAYQQLLLRWDQSMFVAPSATARARDLSRAAVWHKRPAVRHAAVGGLSPRARARTSFT